MPVMWREMLKQQALQCPRCGSYGVVIKFRTDGIHTICACGFSHTDDYDPPDPEQEKWLRRSEALRESFERVCYERAANIPKDKKES